MIAHALKPQEMAFSSSPGQWQMELGDRIEKSLEDVLDDMGSPAHPPRSQTAPPAAAAARLFDDFGMEGFDGGHVDIRLDQSYEDFYRSQVGLSPGHNLPAPLDTTTLFSNFARQVMSDHAQGRPLPTVSPNPHVQQMFANLVHGLQRPESGMGSHMQPAHFDPSMPHLNMEGGAMNPYSQGTPTPPLPSLTPEQQLDLAAALQSQMSQLGSPTHMGIPAQHTPEPDQMAMLLQSNIQNAASSTGMFGAANAQTNVRSIQQLPARAPSPLNTDPRSPTAPIGMSGLVHGRSNGNPSNQLPAMDPQQKHLHRVPQPPASEYQPTSNNTMGQQRRHGSENNGRPHPPMSNPGIAPQMHSMMPPAMNPAFQAAFHAAFQAAWLSQQHGVPPPFPLNPASGQPMQFAPGTPHHQAAMAASASLANTMPTVNQGGGPGYPQMNGRHPIPPPPHPHMYQNAVPVNQSYPPGTRNLSRTRKGRGGKDAPDGRMMMRGGAVVPGYQHENQSMNLAGRGAMDAGGGRDDRDGKKDKKGRGGEADSRAKSVVDELVDCATSIENLEGKMMLMTKEQNGCRYVQKKIDEGGPEALQAVLNEILPHVCTLMEDPFGNYLIQKILDVCLPEQRTLLLKHIANDQLIVVACNSHGTRAVQKLVEEIKGDEEVSMLTAVLKTRIVDLIMDLNGNHVVQRCLQKVSSEHTTFIYDAACENCLTIAQHRHGCCVLQRCIDYSTVDQKLRLVACISQHSLELSKNAFGNYVVQYILDAGATDATNDVLSQLTGHFAVLSCQKFSSNVVEKCLKLSAPGLEVWRTTIVEEIISYRDLAALLKDQFGNYVVQSALRVTSGDLHTNLVSAIKPHLQALRCLPHGKRILSQLQVKG